jgi:UDP-N-acetylglucosamine 2-epimerase (non-hydrolysing)
MSNIKADYSHPLLDAAAGKRLILVTAHRRENLGEPRRRIFGALRRVCEQRSDVFLICPLHKNPEVREIAHKVLSGHRQIALCEPLTPIELHNVMARSFAVVTDSGGIQEEAAHLRVPTLVLRDNTERGEGVECGAARLVGCDDQRIIEAICELIDNKALYERMKSAKSPYGDGRASERIADAICGFLR